MSEVQLKKIKLPALREGDLRIAEVLGSRLQANTKPRMELLGFPCDEGVRRNGGRVGAAEGPDAIREQLFRLLPDVRMFESFVGLLGQSADRGNLSLPQNLSEAQKILGIEVARCFSQGSVPVVFGGGHETAYGHFLGYVEAKQPVSVLNFDAHADVRPLVQGQGHSGSSFREMRDHASKICQSYTVFGLQAQYLSKLQSDYLRLHEDQYLFLEEVNKDVICDYFKNLKHACLVSFDLDALGQNLTPGVSGPSAHGFSAELWFFAAYQAGLCPRVTSFELVELNPRLDIDSVSARMAALTVWHFIKGLCERHP